MDEFKPTPGFVLRTRWPDVCNSCSHFRRRMRADSPWLHRGVHRDGAWAIQLRRMTKSAQLSAIRAATTGQFGDSVLRRNEPPGKPAHATRDLAAAKGSGDPRETIPP